MKRDWKKYNQELVKRGELLFDLGFLEGWKRELKRMNRGKEGARFRYPESFVEFLGVFSLLHGPSDQTESYRKFRIFLNFRVLQSTAPRTDANKAILTTTP